MLAQLARDLPEGNVVYEPKWDGFRCLAFRNDGTVLQSRRGNDLARYFPEVVEGLRALPDPVVLDGELVAPAGFPALMGRIHPAASRVERLRAETPASYVAFDLLALDERDLREQAFVERRRLLEELLAEPPPPLVLTPATRDRAEALAWLERCEGVVAKADDLRYVEGKRAMVKVKRARTADCVVGGIRPTLDRPAVASLLLGLYDGPDLRHVGVASSFPERERDRLFERLAPLAIPLEEHPWRYGYLLSGGPTGRLHGSAGRWTPEMELDWIPLAPAAVCEVTYDQVDGGRFRHPARFLRWRPDRDPRSCELEQII